MKIFLLSFLLLSNSSLLAQKHYNCARVSSPLEIDGKLDDAAWQKAPWTDDFVNIVDKPELKPKLQTRVKMLYDDKYLYIAAYLQEPHVSANFKKRDDLLFKENDFEAFIDPDGDGREYYEFEINAFNTFMDLFMTKPYRDKGKALINYDAKGVRSAIRVLGTLNNPADKDEGWTVEIAIPFSDMTFLGHPLQPKAGDTWRINFLRVEWDQEIKNGQYVILNKPEHNWSWSPQGEVNMHAPEKWGFLHFSGK
jgi:hypothetical protein